LQFAVPSTRAKVTARGAIGELTRMLAYLFVAATGVVLLRMLFRIVAARHARNEAAQLEADKAAQEAAAAAAAAAAQRSGAPDARTARVFAPPPRAHDVGWAEPPRAPDAFMPPPVRGGRGAGR
jgi:hypothetical protein